MPYGRNNRNRRTTSRTGRRAAAPVRNRRKVTPVSSRATPVRNRSSRVTPVRNRSSRVTPLGNRRSRVTPLGNRRSRVTPPVRTRNMSALPNRQTNNTRRGGWVFATNPSKSYNGPTHNRGGSTWSGVNATGNSEKLIRTSDLGKIEGH